MAALEAERFVAAHHVERVGAHRAETVAAE
jgi:hypothetical protein